MNRTVALRLILAVSLGINLGIIIKVVELLISSTSENFSNITKRLRFDSKKQPVHGGIVRVINETAKATCTGSVVSNYHVLTAAHCFNKNDSVYIYDEYYKARYKARPAAANSNADVAILEGDFSNFKPLKTNWARVNIKSTFMSCGYPHNQDKLFCSPIEFTGYESFKMRFSGVLIQRMSGGPIVDMNTEEVIGVNSTVGQSYCVGGPLLGLQEVFGL